MNGRTTGGVLDSGRVEPVAGISGNKGQTGVSTAVDTYTRANNWPPAGGLIFISGGKYEADDGR